MSLRWLIVFALLAASSCLAQENSEADAKLLFRLANQARVQVGRKPLRWSDQLAQAALAHTQRMVRKGQLSHQFSGEPDLGVRLANAGSHFDAYAENVGFAGSAKEVHNGWMHSPGHRRNLLDPSYGSIGIAAVRSGRRLYATQDFADLTPDVSPADATQVVRRILLQRGLKETNEISSEDMKRAACSGKSPNLPKDRRSAVIAHYTTSRPSELPDDLKRQLRGKPQSFSVGACEITDPKHRMTTQAFTVVLFQ